MPTCFKYLSFETQSRYKQIHYHFPRFCWGLSWSSTSFRPKYVKISLYNYNKTHQNSATLSATLSIHTTLHINSSHISSFCTLASVFEVHSYLLFPPILMLCGTKKWTHTKYPQIPTTPAERASFVSDKHILRTDSYQQGMLLLSARNPTTTLVSKKPIHYIWKG